MPWTFAALKAADAALSPAQPDLAAAAAALNAQTVATRIDVATAAIEQIIVPTGEMYTISQASTGIGSPVPSAQVQAVAWSFTRMLTQWTTISTSVAAVWVAAQSVMGELETAGLLSAASIAAIGALVQTAAPVWQPAVGSGDVQTARAQP